MTTHAEQQPAKSKWIAAPSVDDTVFIAGMAVLAAGAVIDWPVAAVIGLGHLTTKRVFASPNRRSSASRDISRTPPRQRV